MKNKPYVKIIENGIVTNPITKDAPYVSSAPNRTARRNKNKFRFIGNNKACHLVVTGILPPVKFFKTVQLIGNKRIEHYNGK